MMRTALQRLNPKGAAPARFIVLCHARSGSNLICWSLGEHRSVEEFGEIFHESHIEAGARLPRGVAPYQSGDDAATFLEQQIFAPPRRRRIGAQGFKIFFEHARSSPAAKSAWTYLIDHPDIRVIHLVRRNLLDCKLSHEIAMRTGHWYRKLGSTSEPQPIEPFSLSPWSCQDFFAQIVTWRMWAMEVFAHHPMLTLDYDSDLCGDFRETMARVFDFVGVPAAPVAPKLVKQRDRSPCEQILNYDELRRWFRHTLFEEFFAPAGAKR